MKSIIKYTWVIGVLTLFSCDGFLDEKPQKSLLVPQTAEEVRALLDYYSFFAIKPLSLFIASDEWVTTSENWESFSPWEQNSYLWLKDVYGPQERSGDYMNLHSQMFYANTSLGLLSQLENGSSSEISEMRGEALTIRSWVLFDLAVMFLPLPQSTLNGQYTIPVNLTSDINAPLTMFNISELIEFIKNDLNEAFLILPEKAEFRTRPDKRVAKALLARIYLYEHNWNMALEAADYVIQHGDGLIDYTQLDPTLKYPFSIFNEETLLYQAFQTSGVNAGSATYISDELFDSYNENDLRKNLFFRMGPADRPVFKGSYTGGLRLFSGVGLSEMYLTYAEAAIRMGNLDEGLLRLNGLGEKRYEDFQPWQDMTQESALTLVLDERKREMIFRGIRWMDMKRIKYLEPSYQPNREINGTVYSLKEESQLIWDLPPYEIELGNL